MPDRRDFLKQAGALAAGFVVTPAQANRPARPAAQARGLAMDPAIRDVLMVALNAAKLAGAPHADVRIGQQRQAFIATREQQIVEVADTETLGCGVRALVDGCWGFAATPRLTKDGVAQAARAAAAVAKANRRARDQRVDLAPTAAVGEASWNGDFVIDPWDVPLEQKTDLLLRANAIVLPIVKVREFTFTSLSDAV
jgi:TldD protein